MTELTKNRFSHPKLVEQFTSKSEERQTPDGLFARLNTEFQFTTDLAATENNTKCKVFYTSSDNALFKTWTGICWLNPPYGRALGKWMKKAYTSAEEGATIVCLVPARTNTNWWHEYCMKAEVRFIRGRPAFKGMIHGLPWPLAIVVFRKEQIPKFLSYNAK